MTPRSNRSKIFPKRGPQNGLWKLLFFARGEFRKGFEGNPYFLVFPAFLTIFKIFLILYILLNQVVVNPFGPTYFFSILPKKSTLECLVCFYFFLTIYPLFLL